MRLRRAALEGLAFAAMATACAAHGDEAAERLAHDWPNAPWLTALLLLSSGLFVVGLLRLLPRERGGRTRRLVEAGCAALGWMSLAIALLSPLDPASDLLFSAHMIQHELLMVCAAPLLVMGRPLSVIPWSLPAAARHQVLAWARTDVVRRPFEALTQPAVAWLLHAAALWGWHVPAAFEAALRHPALHAVQHATFFWTALLFWWAVVNGRFGRLGHGVALLSVFTTSLHGGLLGALLTFAPGIAYPLQERLAPTVGVAPLADQQAAGLVMWVPFGVAFVLAGVALAAAWMGASARRVALGRTETAIGEELP
jgi:putative membrane protein